MRNRWLSRILSWIAVALIGGVFGVAGTIAHSLQWGPIPVGIIIGAIACGSVLVAIRTLTHDRGAAVAAGLGMVGMLLVISGPGPGGSIVVPDTISGQIWTYLVAGLVLVVIAWPSFSRLPAVTQAPTAPVRPAPAPPIITAVPLETGRSEEPPRSGP